MTNRITNWIEYCDKHPRTGWYIALWMGSIAVLDVVLSIVDLVTG